MERDWRLGEGEGGRRRRMSMWREIARPASCECFWVLGVAAHNFWFPKTRLRSVGQVALPCRLLMPHRQCQFHHTMQHKFLQSLPPTAVPQISVSRWPSLVLFAIFQRRHQHRARWHPVKHSTKKMILRPAEQDDACYGGATVLTLLALQQRLVDCVCSLCLLKSLQALAGDSLPQAWVAVA